MKDNSHKVNYFGETFNKPNNAIGDEDYASLSEEFALITVRDDTGSHIIKEKDFQQYFNQKIDNWFFDNDSMGADLVLGDDFDNFDDFM